MIEDFDSDEPEEFGPPAGPPDVIIGPQRPVQVNLTSCDPNEYEIVGQFDPTMAQVFFEQWSEDLLLSSEPAKELINLYQDRYEIPYATARWMAARTYEDLTKKHASLALETFYLQINSTLTAALEELRKDIAVLFASEFPISILKRDTIDSMVESLKDRHRQLQKDIKNGLKLKKQGRPPKADLSNLQAEHDRALPICQRAKDTFKQCNKSPFRDIKEGWRKRVVDENPDFPPHLLDNLRTDSSEIIARKWVAERCSGPDGSQYNIDYLKQIKSKQATARNKKGKKTPKVLTLPKPPKNG